MAGLLMRRLLFSPKNISFIRLLSERSDPFVLERLSGKDEGIVLFSMNYPERKNALSRLFMQQLRECVSAVKFDKNVRVVILKSDVDGIFCSDLSQTVLSSADEQVVFSVWNSVDLVAGFLGADLKERKEMSVEEVSRFVDLLRSSFTELEALPQPVIAAIDGYALGGGLELALACDIRVASANAKVGLIETRLAIIPGAGGTQRLTRAVGLSMAKELIFTGRVISGEEACKIGLVNHCTQSDPLEKAVEIAHEILPKGPIAIRVAKIAVALGSEVSLDCGLLVEQQCYAQVTPTQDRLEGLRAFAEKRTPSYKGE